MNSDKRADSKNPVTNALILAFLFAVVLFPYWWLADRWSGSYFSDPMTHFTFTSTTFLLTLAIIDCVFLIRYYQVRQKNRLNHATKVIQNNAENYRHLIENAPFPIVVTNFTDNKVLVINKKAADLFSVHSKEQSGILITSEFLDQLKQDFFPQSSETEKVSGYEHSFQIPGGDLIHTSISATIIDYLGRKALFTAFVNITERVRLENEIIRREEKFTTIFHEVLNPLVILSDSGKIREINAGFTQYTGLTKEDVSDKKIDDILIFHDNLSRFSDLPEVNLQSPVETTIELPGGERRFVIIHTRTIIINEDSCFLLLIQDIDEMKRTQNAISQANNQLAILSSVTRHDIKNRISIISSFIDFLQKKFDEEPEKRWISIIQKSAEDIQLLIDFTRQYQDLGLYPPKWQNPGIIMNKPVIVSLLTGITLHLPEKELEIYTDPMFEKVLYNLVDNSIQHGERVTDITLSYGKKNNDLILRYEDNGIGIDEKDRKNIFEKGFGKNTGLGLFLIREILKLTGISISEHGRKDTGVKFDMVIPAGGFRSARPGEGEENQ